MDVDLETPLSPSETRVLGCLAEKERATPDNYPLTVNALINACNQTSNRDPVVSYDERTVQSALDRLRERKLTRIVYSQSNRAPKHRHVLDEALTLDDESLAVITVLMLRGPQTPGELRTRTERLHRFDDMASVDDTLTRLQEREPPLVRRLERRPGQKEARYAHLLAGEPDDVAFDVAAPVSLESGGSGGSGGSPARADRIGAIEADVASLREEVGELRAELARLRSALGED